MKVEKIDRRETPYFSNIANDLIYNQEELSDFIESPFSLESFQNQIHKKKNNYPSDFRETLVDVLSKQLKAFSGFPQVKENIEILSKDNTFTVTCGHQLNLYGGPLYVTIKIINTIRLAEKLKIEYPNHNFIPVFWMATEDHDFAEINHVHLFNDTLKWETEQRGAVGKFNLKGIESFKSSVLDKFKNNEEISNYLRKFYSSEDESLAVATRRFLMDLFGDKGLVVIDGDDAALKSLFKPVIKKELQSGFSGTATEEITEILTEKGYKAQVHPREINLFYLEEESRERIIKKEDDLFSVGDKDFTRSELISILEEQPERFSPNVVLRPVYQEWVLPNLCYLGGGGEMAYWLQLKKVFDEIELLFPLISVRNSVQVLDNISLKKMDKLGIQTRGLFDSVNKTKKEYVLNESGDELDFSEIEAVGEELKHRMNSLIAKVDKGLEEYGRSESMKINKQMDHLKQKLIRHQKKLHDDSMNQIENLYERLFPGNVLLERYDNIIPYLAKYGKSEWLNTLLSVIDPFEKDLILLKEE